MTVDRFGVFSPLLTSEGYLALLHLDSRDANKVVSSVVERCRKSAHPYQEIGRLLDEPNWRCHIVAAVALCALGYDERAFIKLWAAFDSGSWVTPQLAVAAYLRDPKFSDNARVRVESRCPVDASRLSSMTALERHISAGPAGLLQRSAKAAASLVGLLSLGEKPEWLTTELSSPVLPAQLSEDIDQAAKITRVWLFNVKAKLTALAIDPKTQQI